MKNLINPKVLFFGLILIGFFSECKKDHKPPVEQFNITQTNLVADLASAGAAKVDTNLKNPWGISANPNGIIWISDNHQAASTIYDKTGATIRPPVFIPSTTPDVAGAPTGQIFNGTTDFGGNKFIFAGEDGVITAWAAGNAAVKVADRSGSDAVYKGIATAKDGGASFLYLANFKGGKVDVFDTNFGYVNTKPFLDPGIPAGYGPFNVQNINGQLFVTYAKLKGPDNEDDDAGPGNGYVDIFTPNGVLVKRFASQGTLNSPWGVALAPAGFAGDTESILIGNFGDGRISVYDMTGKFKGQLQNNGQPLAIEGLWAIDFLKNNVSGAAASTDPLFFTAGPGDEEHGLFGSLQKK